MNKARTPGEAAASLRKAAFADKKYWKWHLGEQRNLAEHARKHRLAFMGTAVGRAHLERVAMAEKRAEVAHNAAAEILVKRLPKVRQAHRELLRKTG
jgi:hypothetical protein